MTGPAITNREGEGGLQNGRGAVKFYLYKNSVGGGGGDVGLFWGGGGCKTSKSHAERGERFTTRVEVVIMRDT